MNLLFFLNDYPSMSQISAHIQMTIARLQDHKHFLEAVLTHEVFKHGLLMSQQVVNNGFPSIKNTGKLSRGNKALVIYNSLM